MHLKVLGSQCYVSEVSRQEEKFLVETLSIEKPGYHPKGSDPRHRFYNAKDMWFPSGLLFRVKRESYKAKWLMELEDQRPKLGINSIEPIQLRNANGELQEITYFDFQEDAINAILEKQRGLVQIATNGGKTAIMAGVLKTLQDSDIRGLIVTHSKEIYPQLLQVFRDNLKSVGEINADTIDVKGKQFVVAMIMTLLNRNGVDPDVTALLTNHHILFCDECHHVQAEQFNSLLKMSPAVMKVGFSGTVPEENTYSGLQVRSYTGDVLAVVSNAELIDQGISAKPLVKLVPSDVTEVTKGLYKRCLAEFQEKHGACFRQGGRWRSVWLKMQFFAFYNRETIRIGVVENEVRNKIIARTAAGLPGKQILVIVDRVQHGKTLCEMTRQYAPTQGVEFIHGTAKQRKEHLEDFKAGRVNILISTKILDEGIDVPCIECLIQAGGMKSRRQLLQRVGRALRRKGGDNTVLIIDIYDKGNKYLTKYAKERLKVFIDEGFDVEIVGGER